jgi:hypothetical protein
MPPIPTNPPIPLFWQQQWIQNMTTTTGMAIGPATVSMPRSKPILLGNSLNWCPAPHEIQIWVAPAGWAEAAYQNNQPIDVSDELTFLDQVRSQEVEVKTTYETSTVRMDNAEGKLVRSAVTRVTLGGVKYIGPTNTYDKMFPIDERRDLLLLVENGKGRAIAVASNVIVEERELVARADDHVIFESVTLVGDNFYPLKEIE